MSMVYIAGTFLGLLLVLVIGFWINSKRPRHSSVLRAGQWTVTDDETPEDSVIDRIVASPLSWVVIFLAVVGLVLGGTFVMMTDFVTLDVSDAFIAGGLVGALLLGYLTYSVYALARSRGHSSALSIAESAVFLGLIAVVVIAAVLVSA